MWEVLWLRRGSLSGFLDVLGSFSDITWGSLRGPLGSVGGPWGCSRTFMGRGFNRSGADLIAQGDPFFCFYGLFIILFRFWCCDVPSQSPRRFQSGPWGSPQAPGAVFQTLSGGLGIPSGGPGGPRGVLGLSSRALGRSWGSSWAVSGCLGPSWGAVNVFFLWFCCVFLTYAFH